MAEANNPTKTYRPRRIMKDARIEHRIPLGKIYEDDFDPLPIKDGVNDYHTNQFRVYFRATHLQQKPQAALETMVKGLRNNFPLIFSGTGYGLKKNIAAVEFGDRKHEGYDTLRFEIDMMLTVGDIKIQLPNLHSDWVYLVWEDASKGFAAQTLKRNFYETGDLLFEAMLPAGYGSWINQHHFLAGRRSWIFGIADANAPGGAIFYLETGSIERYSLMAYKLAELDPGYILNMRQSILDIWTTLLSNFITWSTFTPVAVQHTAYDADEPHWEKNGDVYRRVMDFKTQDECLNAGWIKKDLLPRHPGVAAQF